MTLGRDYAGTRVDGWFCTEKFDGVRGFWDGAQLWTRGGKTIPAPAWVTAMLPAGQRLDGEVWFGYGQFERARVACQFGKGWTADARFLAFDAPDACGDYAARCATIPATLRIPLERVNTADLPAKLATVKARGGEGLMVRNPAITRYETGRTFNLLKVKN